MPWFAAEKTVSPTPRQKLTTASTQIPARSKNTAPASAPTKTHRDRSTSTISDFRLNRSAATPPARPNSSHGSRLATTTSEINSGSDVIVDASSGAATSRIPSPIDDTPIAEASFR